LIAIYFDIFLLNMKATINAPHSKLHGSECEILELNYNHNVHIVKVKSHPHPLPYHQNEVQIDWDNQNPEIAYYTKTVDAIRSGVKEMKFCHNCENTKPVSDFTGHNKYCNDCIPF